MSGEARTAAQSRVVVSRRMEILDAGFGMNVHGGVIMKMVDDTGGMAAGRHCGGRVVTAAIDGMDFVEPAYLGDLVVVSAQVNDVGRTSMEVGVRVEAENIATGERRHVSTAYLVFVALDDEGKPREVPPLVPETGEERRRMEEAKIRRQHRLARKEAILRRRRRQGE